MCVSVSSITGIIINFFIVIFSLMVGPRWAGSLPLSSSKLGREGRHLIQRHRDWLGEFRRSLPRQL